MLSAALLASVLQVPAAASHAAAQGSAGAVTAIPAAPTVIASAGDTPTGGAAASDPDPKADAGSVMTSAGGGGIPQPSTAYEESVAHEHDRIAFRPGARVAVGFTPRAGDRWPVGGQAPVALPAGLASGRAMAASAEGSTWAGRAAASDRSGTTVPATDPTAVAPPDLPAGPTVDARPMSWQAPAPAAATDVAAAAGLRRQVFGFLPYWEVPGASSRLDYGVLSTIAYFSVGADARGNLRKRNADGSLTTGWAGWTSSAMTSVINGAHGHGTRVVLTASVFAWTSSGAAIQKALLGSAQARSNLARQLAAAVRDRGADGVNLDFEPLVAGSENGFVALLRTLRSQLNAIRAGYQLTYDTTGSIGNYPLEASVGPAAADAIFVMGYDYRSGGSATSGSIDPLSGPTYDLTDTIRAYTARVSPSRIILGIPWYGRAWSTASAAPWAANVSGTRLGASTAVNYASIPALIAKYGKRYDAVEQSPYIAYRRQNCTTRYGCLTSWRQVWYDDAASMGRRYALVNDYGLRGAGMWALGYEGTSPDLYRALSDAFLGDHSAPRAGIRMLPSTEGDEGFTVSWVATDVSAVVSYDVQVSVDGGAWAAWLTATKTTSGVWLGTDGHGYAFRVRATDAKGNVGAWNVTSRSAATTSLAAGGFGRVTLDGLAYRAGPGTTSLRMGTIPAGTIVALTSGPVAAGGYTWFEATEPVREWSPVTFVQRGVWIAVASPTATYVVPVQAPNATRVDAGIVGLGFGASGGTGPAAAAVVSRTFSPNGDGARDTLRLRWMNTVAMTSMTLRVYRLDGTLAGSVAVPALAAGPRTFDWNGRAGAAIVRDGRYLLQLVGTSGGRTFTAPSASPVTPAQVASFAVTVDTVAPAIRSASASSALISPNGDRLHDTVAYAVAAPGSARWIARIAGASGAVVRLSGGTGASGTFTWNGRSDAGPVVPDGRYAATVGACDVAGNCATRTFPVTVDTVGPAFVATAAPPSFSPNGDRTADTTTLGWTAPEAATGTASVWRGTTLIRRWTFTRLGAWHAAWNGRTAAGAAAPDGRYTLKIDGRDAAGNRRIVTTRIVVDRTAGALRWSGSFYPQDGDALARTATLRWTQTRTATTTLALYDVTGRAVRIVWANRVLAAGSRAWTWDGRLADGTYAPQGAYQARLTVVSPYATTQLAATVWAAAFANAVSPSTVRPGQVLSVRFRTVEALSTRPGVRFTQPGQLPVMILAVRQADGSYLARFMVRTGGAGAGTVQIAARDSAGRVNAITIAVAIRS
jgi:spore germination protein YaaH/flagellar hook assembly protein FlgD